MQDIAVMQGRVFKLFSSREGGKETVPVFETREEGLIVPAKSSRFYACLYSLAD